MLGCRVIILLLTGTRVFGQAPEQPVIRVDVRQVLVPVIVTDSKGHHVTGLKASDFRVLEDGVSQDIAAFSANTAPTAGALLSATESASAGSAAQTPPATPKSLPHTFVICVDAMHSASANTARVREALAQFFQKEKATEAQYVLLSIGRQVQVLQTATSDPAAVFSRLHSPQVKASFGGGDAATFSSELNDLQNRMYDFCRRCAACGSRSNFRACDSEVQNLKVSVDGQAEHWSLLRDQFLAQLKGVVEELAKLPSGRTLILVSDGFSLQPTREFYAVVSAFLPEDPRFKLSGPTDLESSLQSVIKVATEKNVRIYAIDSRGLAQGSFANHGSMDASVPADRSAPSVIGRSSNTNRGGTLLSDLDRHANAVAFQNDSGMEQLAQSTGGAFFHDSNDMLKQFRSVLADGREYYLLAYVPRNRAEDGKFRRITVEATDKKLHVRAKSGYWSGTAQDQAR
ncbi:MAG TPA: VWA domain-containing protein [Bryobacteraceae bacterium]